MKCEKLSAFNGHWFVITRNYFDLLVAEEPFQSLALLVNTKSWEYIFRVLGTTRYKVGNFDIKNKEDLYRERGICSDVGELENLVRVKFTDTVACLGNPRKDTPRMQVGLKYF